MRIKTRLKTWFFFCVVLIRRIPFFWPQWVGRVGRTSRVSAVAQERAVVWFESGMTRQRWNVLVERLVPSALRPLGDVTRGHPLSPAAAVRNALLRWNKAKNFSLCRSAMAVFMQNNHLFCFDGIMSRIAFMPRLCSLISYCVCVGSNL